MDVTLTFTAYGVAQPAGSKRAFVGKNGKPIVTDDNRKAKPWQAIIADAARPFMTRTKGYEHLGDVPLLTGPLSVSMTFYVQRPKGHYSTANLARNALSLRPS